MPALAALSVPTWQSLMTQRLNLAPSRDVVALCAAAATAGVAKLAMPPLISIRRVREVGSIDVLLCGLASRHSQRRAKAGAGARVSSLLILRAVASQFVADRRRQWPCRRCATKQR